MLRMAVLNHEDAKARKVPFGQDEEDEQDWPNQGNRAPTVRERAPIERVRALGQPLLHSRGSAGLLPLAAP